MPIRPHSTLRKIAEEAGVSINTVSNVLNGKTRGVWSSAAARAERIRQIATRLNYVPHSSARTMRTGRFGTAGILTGTKFFPIQLMQALHTGLARHDMHLAFAEIARRKKQEMEHLPKFLRELSLDGLLIHALIDVPENVQAQLHQLGLAVVFLNTRAMFDAVYPDEQATAERLTRALIELGHRQIGFFNASVGVDSLKPGSAWHYSLHDRAWGYQKAMHDAGFTPTLNFPPSKLTPRESVAYLKGLLASRRFTALVMYEPFQAMQAISLAAETDLRIPDDLQIATFAAEDMHYDAMPWVIAQTDWERFGHEAVEMLMRKVAAPKEPMLSVAVRCSGIHRYDPFRQIDEALGVPGSAG